MLNLLRMDLYRFRTNKVMYLLLLVFSAFQIFGIFMMKQYQQPMEEGGLAIGTMNESQFMQFSFSQPPSWVMLYIVVFTVYFYMSEYSAGFYKNYITMQKARVHSVFSKIVVQAVFTVLMFVVLVISDLIGRGIFFGNISIGDWGYFTKLVTGQIVLHWTFSIVILWIVIWTRNILISLSIGLILVLNVIGLILSALESLFEGVQLSSYWIVSTMMSALDYHSGKDLLHVAIVAVLSLVLFTVFAVQLKVKEDLR